MSKRPRPKAMRMVTEFRGREVRGDEAERLRHEAAIGLEVTKILTQRARPMRTDAVDRADIRHAMDTVEARIVEALWTLARLPEGRRPDGPNKHGVEYLQDRMDRWGAAVSEKGFETPPPRPPLPSARAIDAMYEPLEWLSLVPKDSGKLITVAAATKRGDAERKVSWGRVTLMIPEITGCSVRTLQRRYESGIRAIVAELVGRAPR